MPNKGRRRRGKSAVKMKRRQRGAGAGARFPPNVNGRGVTKLIWEGGREGGRGRENKRRSDFRETGIGRVLLLHTFLPSLPPYLQSM